MLKFGEYAPDAPDYQNGGSGYMFNVLPRTIDSYGPMSSLAAYSGALGARCQGAVFVRDSDASAYGFAGTASKLYKLGSASTSWADVSKVGGYTTAVDERWNYTLYGRRVLAANFFDPIQSYVMGASALFADLAAAAPKARYIAAVREFIMVANTFDGTDGNQPQRVWWSAAADPTNWPTPGTVTAAQLQSDFQDLVGVGGWIQGLAPNLSACDVAVIQEKKVYRSQYIGPPYVFAFQPVEGARGSPAPGSIITVGPVAYYLGEDGFYAFDGAQSLAIGNSKVDRTFWSMVQQSYLYRISAAYDPQAKIIYWSFPGPGASAGTPNYILAYNIALSRWTLIGAEVEVLCNSTSFGYTLDQLDSFGTLDTLPYSLDSRAWVGGGRTLLSAFDTSHKLGIFSGSSLAATMDGPEVQINPQGRAFVAGVRPIVDSSAATVSCGTRNLLSDSVSYAAAVSQNALGDCPQRSDARFFRPRMVIPAAANWNHAQGFEVRARRSGYR